MQEFKSTAKYVYEQVHRLYFRRMANKSSIEDRAAWQAKILCALLDPVDIFLKKERKLEF